MTPPDDTDTPETLAWTDDHIHCHDEEGGFWIALDDPTPFMEKLERERGQWRAAAEALAESVESYLGEATHTTACNEGNEASKTVGLCFCGLEGLSDGLEAFREAGKDQDQPEMSGRS